MRGRSSGKTGPPGTKGFTAVHGGAKNVNVKSKSKLFYLMQLCGVMWLGFAFGRAAVGAVSPTDAPSARRRVAD